MFHNYLYSSLHWVIFVLIVLFLVSLKYVTTIPPHSTSIIVICFILFKSYECRIVFVSNFFWWNYYTIVLASKIWFQPVNGVQSTHMLVKIHNIQWGGIVGIDSSGTITRQRVWKWPNGDYLCLPHKNYIIFHLM